METPNTAAGRGTLHPVSATPGVGRIRLGATWKGCGKPSTSPSAGSGERRSRRQRLLTYRTVLPVSCDAPGSSPGHASTSVMRKALVRTAKGLPEMLCTLTSLECLLRVRFLLALEGVDAGADDEGGNQHAQHDRRHECRHR